MPDTSGHDAPERDDLHTVTLAELEVRVAADGVLISRRQLMRHCEFGTFDAKKLPALNNQKHWFIAPASIEKGIADIKTLQEQRSRRDASRRDATEAVDVELSRHDTSRHGAPQPDTSGKEISQKTSETEPATTRYVALLERDNEFLREQVSKKDEQITDLSKRFGETQTLLGAMQRMLAPLLGQADPFVAPPEKREAEGTPTV